MFWLIPQISDWAKVPKIVSELFSSSVKRMVLRNYRLKIDFLRKKISELETSHL